MACTNCSCDLSNHELLEFSIEEDQSLLIQKYYFEMSSLIELLTQFTSNTTFKPDKERYLLLIDDYKKIYISYNLLLSELHKKVCNDNNLNIKNYNVYSVDFINNKILLEKQQ